MNNNEAQTINNAAKTLEEIARNQQKESFKFRTKICDEEGPIIKINKLLKDENCDFKQWTDHFFNTMQLCNFEEKIALKWLRVVTDSFYHEIFGR